MDDMLHNYVMFHISYMIFVWKHFHAGNYVQPWDDAILNNSLKLYIWTKDRMIGAIF